MRVSLCGAELENDPNFAVQMINWFLGGVF